MEKVVTLTKLDFRTLKYCNLFLMKFQRKTKLWLLVTIVLSLGIAVYDIIAIQTYLFTALGVIFSLYSVYQFLSLEKKLDQQLINFFRGRNVNTQSVIVTEENVTVIRSVDPENPVVYDWALVSQIFEMPQYFMLMVGKGSPIIIDRSLDALLEGEKSLLDAIILEKSSLKPFKKTEEDIVKIPVTFVHEVYPTEEAVNVESVDVTEEAETEVLEVEEIDAEVSEENDSVE